MTRASIPIAGVVLELLDHLRDHGAVFLIVGAHALGIHGAPRYTGDFDLLVRPDTENARRVWNALAAFGAPVRAHGLTPEDLATPGTIYQVGLPPRRIDLLTAISGVTFDEAWSDRLTAVVEGRDIPFLGLASLVRNKRATGRAKDLLDIELLREAGVPIGDD